MVQDLVYPQKKAVNIDSIFVGTFFGCQDRFQKMDIYWKFVRTPGLPGCDPLGCDA